MSKKKLKERKERNRKECAKKAVLTRREKLRKMRKEADEAERFKKHFGIKVAPYRKNVEAEVEPAMTKQTKVDDPRQVEYIKQKLEHNMMILEALEEEFKREEAQREKLREELESEGAYSIREKLDLLAEKASEKLGIQDWSNLSSEEEISSIPLDLLDGSVEAYIGPNFPSEDN